MRVLILVAIATTTILSSAHSCQTRDDCQLLGDCIDSQCTCDKGWKGLQCNEADLMPYTAGNGYVNTTAASWGGRPILVNGSYHLFAAEMANSCPLADFATNSQIIRAESESLLGPYHKVETLLLPFAHNPTAIGPTPDGYYLLLFIANGVKSVKTCTNATRSSSSNTHHYGNVTEKRHIGLAWSRSVLGPWQQRAILPDDPTNVFCGTTNPSAVIMSNGTIVLAYRSKLCSNMSEGQVLGIATAPHFTKPFVRHPTPIVTPAQGFGDNEDPFIFYDTRRAAFHIVAHNQGPGCVCGRSGGGTCASHLYSHDAFTWRIGSAFVYNATAHLSDGSQKDFVIRQRPQLFLDKDGYTPLALFNGASFDGGIKDPDILTHTFAFAFNNQ